MDEWGQANGTSSFSQTVIMRHPVFYQVDKAPGIGPGPRLALRLADAIVWFLSLSSTHTYTLSLPGMPLGSSGEPTEESPN